MGGFRHRPQPAALDSLPSGAVPAAVVEPLWTARSGLSSRNGDLSRCEFCGRRRITRRGGSCPTPCASACPSTLSLHRPSSHQVVGRPGIVPQAQRVPQLVREDRRMHLPARVELRPQDLSTLREEHASSGDRELPDHTDIPCPSEPLILWAHLKQDGPESAPSGSPCLPRCGERLLILSLLTKHGLDVPPDARLLPYGVDLDKDLADLVPGEGRVELRSRAGGKQVHAHGE